MKFAAHLWVIATEPNEDGFVLVVSLTSLNGSKDQTVILHGGEHPFLKWATSVAYGLSDLISCDALQEHLLQKRAKMHFNMSRETTELILYRVPVHEATDRGFRQALQILTHCIDSKLTDGFFI